MKRILAVFLTLAMALNIAPVAAFAAADSDAASIVAVEETDETSSPQLDEETARAIASDPFLQAASAQTEQEQTGQAEVDTSDVSIKATDSFGQLLVNGMEEQTGTSGTYTSRVTKVQLNGHTASVEFVTDQTADLVVAIYTDDTAEKMVASGTVEVSGSGGNGAAKVTITGEIPETYTVKAFLLDKKEHAPLSEVYTDSSHTQVMVELSTAKASDFPEDRVVNLDGQDDTNFVVVKQNVTLISYAENPAGENVFAGEDGTGLVYVIEHASAEVKGLQKGDILTYEYALGEMLIVRVSDIAVSGDTVTIYGDDTLDITDVFDAVKIENEADNDQLKYDGSTADAGVTYLGEEDADFSFVNEAGGVLEESNDVSVEFDPILSKDPREITGKASKKFKMFKEENENVEGGVDLGDGTKTHATLSGIVNVCATMTVGFYVAADRKYFSMSANAAMSGDYELSGKIETRIKLGWFGFSPITGCRIVLEPTFVAKAEVKLSAQVKTSATIGFVYDSNADGVQNLSKAPNTQISVKVEGSLYVGIDIHPSVLILGKIVTMEAQAEFGGTGKFTEKVWNKDITVENDSIHGCSTCYQIELSVDVKLGAKLKFLDMDKFSMDVKIIDWDMPLGEAYYAPDYDDFGMGSCPHTQYKVLVTCSQGYQEGLRVYLHERGSNGAELVSEAGEISAWGYLRLYLDPGSYYLTAQKGSDLYRCDWFTVTSEPCEAELSLYASTEPDHPNPNPDPDKPDPDKPDPNPDTPDPDEPENTDFAIEDGVLTIYNKNILEGYEAAEETPWYAARNEIRSIVIKSDITTIDPYVFAECSKVEKVTFEDKVTAVDRAAFDRCTGLQDVYYPGTTGEWAAVSIGEKNEALWNAKVHCTDAVLLGWGTCGSGLNWKLDEQGVLTISGDGRMTDYAAAQDAPWYKWKDEINNIIFEKKVRTIGSYAFAECGAVKEITLKGQRKRFSVSYDDYLEKIGQGAFENCTNLTDIYYTEGSVTDWYNNDWVEDDNVPLWQESVTLHCKDGNANEIKASGQCGADLTWVLTKAGCLFISGTGRMDDYTTKGGAPWGGYSIDRIIIAEGVESIGNYACSFKMLSSGDFYVPDSLCEVILPESLQELGKNAFNGRTALTHISIPESVRVIPDYAFSGCSNLNAIELPSETTEIGSSAFGGCSALKEIELPERVETIGSFAFQDCSALETIKLPEQIKKIELYTFGQCKQLKQVTLPGGVTSIAMGAFSYCTVLKDIYFGGTMAQWKRIEVGYSNSALNNATIHCTDGDILPTSTASENSITTGTASTSDSKFQATFANAKAGKEYVVLVSRSDSAPLNADNLIYINQITADADGELAVPFITAADAAEMTYVVACAQDGAPVDPDQPGGDKPSSGDDGGGAAIILIGGVAAVAAVAGVVMLMPVKVEGTVKLADQPVANATVQVLKGDTVKAETVTDANGHFTVKVKRGGYTLRVQWTDVSGQPVTRTVDFKAPNANLNVAA